VTKEEIRIYNQKYYQLNKRKIKDYNKEYRKFHLKEKSILNKKYHKLNSREEKIYIEKYRKEHKKEIRECNKKYEKLHPKDKTYMKSYYQNHRKELKLREKIKREKWMILIHELGMDKCSKCRYNRCFAAIDFHHSDPKEKKFNIGNLLNTIITPERIEELKKTTPLCSNCHRELHDGEKKNKEEKEE
jgi:hypothetical protein